jgi:hypothetical protein
MRSMRSPASSAVTLSSIGAASNECSCVRPRYHIFESMCALARTRMSMMARS